jgi:hypothetical protein
MITAGAMLGLGSLHTLLERDQHQGKRLYTHSCYIRSSTWCINPRNVLRPEALRHDVLDWLPTRLRRPPVGRTQLPYLLCHLPSPISSSDTIVSETPMQSDWRAIAERKRAARDALIPEAWRIPPAHMPNADGLDVLHIPVQCGILSAAELEITDTSAEGILECIRNGKWTARAVCLAFCKRAAVAQQLVCFSHVSCIETAHPRLFRSTACQRLVSWRR